MQGTRTEKDIAGQWEYRCRVSPSRGRPRWWSLRTVEGWRFTAERVWTRLDGFGWAGGYRADDWQRFKRGQFRVTKASAEHDAHDFLDSIAARNPDPDDYVTE